VRYNRRVSCELEPRALTSAFAQVDSFLTAAVSARGYNAAVKAQEQAFELAFCERSPMSERQICKPKISDANTQKMVNAVANGFKHLANLPIDSLPQHNAQTRRRDRLKSRNFGPLAIQKNSAQEFRRKCWVPPPIQHHLIFLVDLITWVGKALCKFTIVCEKKQTFSLRVQTADVEEAGKFLWKQIKDSVTRMLIASGRNKSGGFVQHNR
jgi:hypothetical protein